MNGTVHADINSQVQAQTLVPVNEAWALGSLGPERRARNSEGGAATRRRRHGNAPLPAPNYNSQRPPRLSIRQDGGAQEEACGAGLSGGHSEPAGLLR